MPNTTESKTAFYGEPQPALINPLDLHSLIKKRSAQVTASTLDINTNLGYDSGAKLDLSQWLPFAAKVYAISPDVADYLLIPVVTILSDLPNRNGVGFPLADLVAWDGEHGCQAYKTFRGKPVYREHANTQFLEAKGVIVDVLMRKLTGFANDKIWKVIELLAIDRTKDPALAQQLLSGEANAFSMGCMVTSYSCGYCHADMGKCSHLNPKNKHDFYKHQGKLVYRRAHCPVGFETSV